MEDKIITIEDPVEIKTNLMDSGLRARARALRWVLRLTWGIAPGFLIGLISIAFIQSGIPAALAWVAKSLIDAVVIELDAGNPNAALVMFWLWIGLGLAAVEAASRACREYLSQRLADELTVKVTTETLRHAAGLEIKVFEDLAIQDSLDRAKRMTGNNVTALLYQSFGSVTSALQVISLVAVLVAIQPLTLLVVGLVTPPFFIVRWILARRTAELEYERATKRRWTGYFMDLLTNKNSVPETRLLGLAPMLIQKYHALMVVFADENSVIHRSTLRAVLIFSLVSVAAFYGLLTELTLRALHGGATLGDVAVFFAASAQLRSGLEQGVTLLTGLFQGTLQVSALKEFYQNKTRGRVSTEPVTAGCMGAIKLEKVDFTYPGSAGPVLKEVSLEIGAGETVALVGENGCGKTTLAKLMARLYTPDGGRITLDGRDLQELEIRSLHRQISFIFQNFSLYEATAADNIAYGDWENILGDREQIEKVAQAAGVHDMLTSMPDGYDTMLGRSFGKFNLSGGQWQRLAVARAFARPSAVLILDEPTAALDARSEYELFVRARKLAEGRTTILISHRFSTVSIADRIVVMDDGRIIEQGSHTELVNRGGHYAELYKLHNRQMPAVSSQG